MVRVLHIGPDGRALGGIASVIQTYTHPLTRGPLSVRQLATVNEGNRLRKLLVAAKAYVRAPFEIKWADIIHIHTASRNSWRRKVPLVVLAKLQRRKLVIHVHGGGFVSFLDSMGRWRLWLNTRLLSLADCIVCLSTSKRAELSSHLSTVPVVIIPNPCRFVPSAVNVRRRPGVRILFTGLIDRSKGVFELIQAFALIVRECPRDMLKLTIAGGGKADACRRLACACGVEDKVLLPGWLESDALREAYAQADIYCLPSYVEGLPMGVLEAMAFALPIVASRVGGIPDIVDDGVHGLLVQPGGVNGIAGALKRLIDNRDERDAMGAACRERVLSRYSPEHVSILLGRLYRSLLADGGPHETSRVGQASELDENHQDAPGRGGRASLQTTEPGRQQQVVSNSRI